MKSSTAEPGSPMSFRSGRRPFPWTSKQRNHRPSFNVLGSRSAPVSDDQAFQLAVEAVRKALETQQHTEKESALDTDINHGMTINLSGKKIGVLTDSIIKVLPRDIQRLALPENMLSNIPLDFSIFSSLRYLNARNNCIKAFPPVVFHLPRLEILDLSFNKIKNLPDDISSLTSLKVLALKENLLEEIPLCIADMTLLQVFKVEGNPLNQRLRRILTNHRSSTKPLSEPAGLADIAVTTRIKQYLKDTAPSAISVNSLKETRSQPSPMIEPPKHSSKPSRSGRFPVKVRDSIIQSPSQPPSPIAFHSKAFSQQSLNPRSPCLIPPTITEGRDSVHKSPKVLSIYTGVTSSISHGRPPLWNTPQSPMRVQRPRRVSFGAEPHRPIQMEKPASFTNSGERNVLTTLAAQSSRPLVDDPLLGMARTIYLSINQLHLPLQALAGLASDTHNRRSILELMIEKATLDINILGQLIQKHSRVPSHQQLEETDMKIIRHTCVDLINNYMVICSQVVLNIDRLMDRGDPRFIRNLISLMYSSIMSFRAEFMQDLRHGDSDFSKTVRPDHSSRARAGPRSHRQQASPTNQTSYTPTISPTATPEPEKNILPEPRRGWEYLDLIQVVLERSCGLVLGTLPILNQRIKGNLTEILAQEPKPHIIETWQLLIMACARMIEQASCLERNLPSAMRGNHLDKNFWSVCYEYVEAWTQLGELIKSSRNIVGFSSDTMRIFQQIQRSVKEVTGLTMSPKPTPVESPTSPRSDISLSSTSTPMTPLQASLGPAIEIISLHSP